MSTISEIMSPSPYTLRWDATVRDAASLMREKDVGDVLIIDNDGALSGIATDRDLVVRVMADGRDPDRTGVADACSSELVTVGPADDVEVAVRLMREDAVRRLPVIDEQDRPVGVVSIGDLAKAVDPASALADISAAPPNN